MSTLAWGRQTSIIFLLGLFTNVALRYEFYMDSVQNDFQISVQEGWHEKDKCKRQYKFERNITLIHEVKLWADVVNANLCRTRMHSSRMRTAHSLPGRGGSLFGRGVSVQGCQWHPPKEHGTRDKDPPWKEHGTKDRDPPWKEHGTRDRDPLEGTWAQAAREEVTSYRDPLPVDRITDASKNVTLPQTSFAGGNNMMLFHSLSTKPLYIE